ncbi:MAG TPA: D-glycero-beta-D-manno-heptose-7-phosphate kinase [Nitrospiraceae bacterium]|jgi:D-beta-D-heptose 7-phosphate kinase/D-beta-D-heptose 1-phosphate adenosyltransferase|nr:D-glycero-beta-D-manno-heptose-7-phosphate kinase [Nitrospiraceae bacterium]
MNVQGILKKFKNSKILVIGDLILDRYIWGKVSRISPEAPVPVVEVTDDNFVLGGAANVAYNIVALGGKTTVAGVVGKDRAGDVLRQLLDERGVASVIVEDSRPTTVKTRVIAHNQQVVRFDREDRERITGKALEKMLDFMRDAISEHDGVIISDYRKGVVSRELIKNILSIAKSKRKLIAVDPKVGHFHCYKGVSLITPNLMEASSGSGIDIRDEKSLLKAAQVLMKKVSCSAVLITRGEEGMSLFEGSRVTHIPTVAQHIYDVTGAGDTVIATFSLAYASGATMQEAAAIANHAAGLVVGEVGTAVVTPQKLCQSLRCRY